MLCILFLYSLSYYCVTLYCFAINWQCVGMLLSVQIGSVIPACLLGVVFAIVVRGVLVTLSICVIYWLSVCVVSICCLIRSCWLVSILPCKYTINTYIPLYIACICPLGVLLVSYTIMHLRRVLISLYLYYWVGMFILLFIFIFSFCLVSSHEKKEITIISYLP